jgi:hypothetical protein
MILQEDIKPGQEIFTCLLGSVENQNTPGVSHESFFTFGYIVQDLLDQAGLTEPHWAPVDNSLGFWQFDSAHIRINGEVSNRPRKNTAIADTGTTLCLLDDETVDRIYKEIPGAKYDYSQQGWIFPKDCTNLPTVELYLNGYYAAINPKFLDFSDAGDNMTYGAIQSRGNLSMDIWGDAWLRNGYAIFDVGNCRFGYVPVQT